MAANVRYQGKQGNFIKEKVIVTDAQDEHSVQDTEAFGGTRGPRVASVFAIWRHAAQIYLADIVEALWKKGLKIDVYSRTPTRPGAQGGECHALRGSEGLTAAFEVAVDMFRSPTTVWRLLRAETDKTWRYRLRRWLDIKPLFGRNYDVVHLQNAQLFPIVAPFARSNGAKLIVSFRGYDTLVRPEVDDEWPAVLQEIYRRADRLHFVSQSLLDSAISLGAPPEKCVVIRCSVDTQWFRGSGSPKVTDVCRIITTGRLTWEKAYPLALLVVRELISRGIPVRYFIAGDGAERTCVTYWTRRLGLDGCVTILGFLDRVALRRVLDEADVYFHPSVTEALGVAILEAQAMELPVVATSVDGISEAAVAGETAALLPFGDVKGLADAIQTLWEKPLRRTAMGEAGRRWVESQYSLEREVEEWIRLYTSLAEE